jgi:hypothetical protein
VAAEQLRPFRHAGQAVPAAGGGEVAGRAGAGVLDGEDGVVRHPFQAHVHACAGRVFPHVVQRLLGGPIERQPGVGGQRDRVAGDGEPTLPVD